MSYKERLIEHLQAMIEGRINEAETAIASTYASRKEASHSNAVHKHEVGRAMIQQELYEQGSVGAWIITAPLALAQ